MTRTVLLRVPADEQGEPILSVGVMRAATDAGTEAHIAEMEEQLQLLYSVRAALRACPRVSETAPKESLRAVFFAAIAKEVDRAYAKHGCEQWGRHEFYGVIAEEFDEMWQAIRSDAADADLTEEIVQVAAMCLRYMETGDRYRSPAEKETP